MTFRQRLGTLGKLSKIGYFNAADDCSGQRPRLLFWLVPILLVGTLILSGAYWWRLELANRQMRDDDVAQANKRASQLAELQAHHIEALILGADQALRQYRDAIAAGRRDVALEVAHAALRAFPEHSLIHFASSDARGELVLSTAQLTQPVNIADRDYFRWHLQNHGDTLFITKPIVGRLVKQWVILLSRPIYRGNRLLGIAFVSMSPTYLSAMLAKVKMDPGDIAILVYADGMLMARSSEMERMLGTSVARTRPYLAADAPQRGNFRADSIVDGLPHLFAWYRVDAMPLIVSVGLDEASILAPVEKQIAASHRRSLWAMLLLWLAMGVIAWLLLRAARQQTFLQKSEALLRSTFDSTEAGILVVSENGKLAASNRRLDELWHFPGAVESKEKTADLLQFMANQVVDPQGFVDVVGEPLDAEEHLIDEIRCVDGRVFERYTQTFQFGSQHMRFFAFRDISARIKADDEQCRLNRALRMLSDCNNTLIRADNEYHLLNTICRLIVERGGYLLAWVGYAEEDAEKSVRVVGKFGKDDGYLAAADITWDDTERGRGPVGTAIRSGKFCAFQDFLRNPHAAPWREQALSHGFRSNIALPLVGAHRVFGALTIHAGAEDAFNATEVELLEELANDLAYGIEVLRGRAEHAATKEELNFLSYFDPLTRLPNLLLLRDRFEYAVQQSGSARALKAFLYVDLDNFRSINDGMGTETADKLLQKAVGIMQACIGIGDSISRRSGDEFILLLGDVADEAEVTATAAKILEAIAEPLLIDACAISTSASIGISLYPHDGNEFNELVQKSNTAVGYAKGGGGNTYRFFAEAMNRTARQEMEIIGLLHQALKNREFLLHYQPQICVKTRKTVAVEALIRWQRPALGLVAPAQFIPLAEQSGHIVQIGEWVIHEACRQARRWADEGRELVVAVNLSALQFKRSDVAEIVRQALADSGLPPHHLELELTESVLLQDIEETLATLRQLKAMGVKLSIDDFGTGYSSLAYLKQLAVDKLKIDQSFVRNLLDDADDASIVRAIVQLGHALQLRVIAEGVETDAQFAFLAEIGCHEVQGYLFSRPLPHPDLADYLLRMQ